MNSTSNRLPELVSKAISCGIAIVALTVVVTQGVSIWSVIQGGQSDEATNPIVKTNPFESSEMDWEDRDGQSTTDGTRLDSLAERSTGAILGFDREADRVEIENDPIRDALATPFRKVLHDRGLDGEHLHNSGASLSSESVQRMDMNWTPSERHERVLVREESAVIAPPEILTGDK